MRRPEVSHVFRRQKKRQLLGLLGGRGLESQRECGHLRVEGVEERVELRAAELVVNVGVGIERFPRVVRLEGQILEDRLLSGGREDHRIPVQRKSVYDERE